MEKITQEELDKIKSLQTNISSIIFDLGKHEADIAILDNLKEQLNQSKKDILSTLLKLNSQESELLLELKNKYGDINMVI